MERWLVAGIDAYSVVDIHVCFLALFSLFDVFASNRRDSHLQGVARQPNLNSVDCP